MVSKSMLFGFLLIFCKCCKLYSLNIFIFILCSEYAIHLFVSCTYFFNIFVKLLAPFSPCKLSSPINVLTLGFESVSLFIVYCIGKHYVGVRI